MKQSLGSSSVKLIQTLKRTCNINCKCVRLSTHDYLLSWRQGEAPNPSALEREILKHLGISEAMDHTNAGSLGRIYSYKGKEGLVQINFTARTILIGDGSE